MEAPRYATVGDSLLTEAEVGTTTSTAATLLRHPYLEPLSSRPFRTIATIVLGALVLLAVTFLTLREAARRKLDAAGVKVLPWRPHLILRVYRTSHRNLLDSVRCVSESSVLRLF